LNASESGALKMPVTLYISPASWYGLDAERNLALVVVRRCLGREVQRAAEGVAAEVRALRPAQDLDSLHVDEHRIGNAARHRRDAELVEIVADRIDERVLARRPGY
jgi:hypothetical protein